MTSKGVFAFVWLESFARNNGDKLPDQIGIHLACCLTKKSVYLMYKDETEDSVSASQFFRIWKTKLSYIKIPMVSRFTICDTCYKINIKMKSAITKKEKNLLIKYRDTHLRQQNRERAKYYKHITKARNNPKKYLSIIIDGMDQAKTNIPHLVKTPKTLSNIFQLKVNLTGAIVHGQGIYGFFDPQKYSHGANYTISVLINLLRMMTSIPEVLYLQLDNCPGANKNRFMLGFLSALVARGVFKKVKVGFLMVGHTHEDIDQVFSRYSVWLRYNDALTMDTLLHGFEQCYTPKPTALLVNCVYNISEYLVMNTIKNHSRPHVFRITMDDGNVIMKYKKWSTDQEWLVSQGLPLLKAFNPQGEVQQIKPTAERISEKTKTDTQILAKFLKNETLSRWWYQFFEDLHEDVNTDKEPMQIMDDLASLKMTEEECVGTNNNIDIEEFEDINAPIPEISIGGVRERERAESRGAAQTAASNDIIVQSLQKGNVIAVYTDDRNFDFYLMKVTVPARTLTKAAEDDWGNSFASGSCVIQGQYYDLLCDNSYTLISGQKCIVFASSVLNKVSDTATKVFNIDQSICNEVLSKVKLIK